MEQSIARMGAGGFRGAAGFRPERRCLLRFERCPPGAWKVVGELQVPEVILGSNRDIGVRRCRGTPEGLGALGAFAAAVREQEKRRRATGVTDRGHAPHHFDHGMISVQGAPTEER